MRLARWSDLIILDDMSGLRGLVNGPPELSPSIPSIAIAEGGLAVTIRQSRHAPGVLSRSIFDRAGS